MKFRTTELTLAALVATFAAAAQKSPLRQEKSPFFKTEEARRTGEQVLVEAKH